MSMDVAGLVTRTALPPSLDPCPCPFGCGFEAAGEADRPAWASRAMVGHLRDNAGLPPHGEGRRVHPAWPYRSWP